MEEKKDELVKKVLKEIEQSGFLFELQVQKKFNKRGWFTKPNLRVKTDEKELEMDLVAHKTTKKELANNLNFVNIICSCKKSRSNPIVFFLSKRQSHHHAYNILKFNSNSGFRDTNTYEFSRPDRKKINLDSLKINIFNNFAKTHFVAFTKSGTLNSRKIYETIEDILLYLKYELKKDRNSLDGGKMIQKINHLYMPIIALDGILYGVEEKAGKIKIKEYDFIPLIIDSGDRGIGQLLIHVVQANHIDKFLAKLEKDLINIDRQIEVSYKKKPKNPSP